MKKLVNPTNYFFSQAEEMQDERNPEIDQFVNKLINKNKCELCRFNYDSTDRVPRILIHCGHTFCTPCLEQFFTNRRVRCPMCLKLVKYMDGIQRLPINHSILTEIIYKQNQQLEKEGKPILIKDPTKYIFCEFQRIQKQAHRLQNPQKIDRDSGLLFCVFHPDRVDHFYCKTHNSSGCRVCIEIGHAKSDCNVIDLYQEDNPHQYLRLMEGTQKNIEQPDISDPYLPIDIEQNRKLKFLIGTSKIGKNEAINYIQNFLDDDSDEQIQQI